MKQRKRLIGTCVAVAAGLAGCRGRDPGPAPAVATPSAAASRAPFEPKASDPDVAAAVKTVITSAHHPEMRWPDIPDVAPVLEELYAAEADGLFWFAGPDPYPGTAGIVKDLAIADDQGLRRDDYDADRLAERFRAVRSADAPAAQRALFDLALTADVARLVSAVNLGRVDPATLAWGYDIEPKQLDRAAVLRDLRDHGNLARVLAQLEPPFTHYARARRVLARYRAAAAAGEPPAAPPVPKGQKVEPETTWAGVAPLAARLRVFGDLTGDVPPAAGGEPVYSGPLVEAVKRFQRRHGLESDGVIGTGTVAALNVPLAHRVEQVELAMERMRWLPKMSDQATVFVNVPLFRLWATDPRTGDEPLRMNVVVGKSLDHKTPIFIDRMEYVIFRPYWNPPYSITVKEIVPHAKRDPGYFKKEDLEIVASGADDAPSLPVTPENLAHVLSGRLTVRQRPGPKNSLGLAKFIFPNAENVYMHGTPAQSLFSRARRDFSHGCIRLEDPARLAEWVLRDQPEWTRARIDAAMQGARPTRVNLKQPLTVILFYDTVHVNSEGVLFFVEDIYGHDRQLEAALDRGYPYPTKD